MTFSELLKKMQDANDAGHGEKEAGFRLSTWLMIMEHINTLEDNLGLTNDSILETKQDLESKVSQVKEEVERTEQQITADDADKLMF
jgi:Na+/phosphate symporter